MLEEHFPKKLIEYLKGQVVRLKPKSCHYKVCYNYSIEPALKMALAQYCKVQ